MRTEVGEVGTPAGSSACRGWQGREHSPSQAQAQATSTGPRWWGRRAMQTRGRAAGIWGFRPGENPSLNGWWQAGHQTLSGRGPGRFKGSDWSHQRVMGMAGSGVPSGASPAASSTSSLWPFPLFEEGPKAKGRQAPPQRSAMKEARPKTGQHEGACPSGYHFSRQT